MANPRAADDYPVIRARLKELRREREQIVTSETPEAQRAHSAPSGQTPERKSGPFACRGGFRGKQVRSVWPKAVDKDEINGDKLVPDLPQTR